MTYPIFSATDLIHEMARANVRPAAAHESGWRWRSVDGRTYWVTSL